jgi:hypothetical protein
VSQTQPTAAATHVSAGYICAEPRVEFFRYMDAANIDLKGFTEGFYKHRCSGWFAPVLETLEYLRHETNVWFEITTLLGCLPGFRDSVSGQESLEGGTEMNVKWKAPQRSPTSLVKHSCMHKRQCHRPISSRRCR